MPAFVTTPKLRQLARTMKPREVVEHITEALEEKHISPSEFSIRDLFEGLVPDGTEALRMLDPRQTTVFESSAVNTSLFSYITKSVIGQMVKDRFEMEDFVLTRMIPTVTSRIEAEVVPGMQGIGDRGEVVAEGDAYPTAQFSEDYMRMPVASKKGLVIQVTREAVYFDRTNLVLEQASRVGEALGIRREKEIADTIIDNPKNSATGGLGNRMDWKSTVYATYDTGTNWTNSSSNPLVDWTDLDNAEQLLNNMLDPWTGEPILMTGATLLIPPSLKHAASRVVESTSLVDGTSRGTDLPTYSERRNPYTGLNVIASRFLYRRIINGGNAGVAVSAANAAQYWYFGDFRKAFTWLEHFPLTVDQLGAGSSLDFSNDIVAAFKARYKGTAATKEPRTVIRSIN